jgi:hypothetical protein
VNQFALFSLMSSPDASLHDWLDAHPALATRVVVPARLKWEVRDKLDQANVNERVLFPGLDGLSRWLTRYYWNKPASTLVVARKRTALPSSARRKRATNERRALGARRGHT